MEINTNDLITNLQCVNKKFSELVQNMSVQEYQEFNNTIRKFLEINNKL